jgi:hypothetical protein
MDERACRRGTCGRSGLLTRVVSQTGPGSLAHDRQFGVNAQCLGPAACTCVRAWLSGGVPCRLRKRMRPEDQRANRQEGKQTTVTRRAAQSMADTNASGCYSRLLREANTLKNQQCRKASARAVVRQRAGPRRRAPGPRGRVRSRECLLLGMFARAAPWCGAGGGDGRWLTRRGRRAGRCDSSDYV